MHAVHMGLSNGGWWFCGASWPALSRPSICPRPTSADEKQDQKQDHAGKKRSAIHVQLDGRRWLFLAGGESEGA